LNFYPRYVGDYERDTGHLSWEEHWAYTRLLDILYATEKPLPTDLKILIRMTNASKIREKKALFSVLSQFFFLTDFGYSNKRFEEELTKAESRSNKAKTAAKSRWNRVCSKQSSEHATSNAPAMPSHNHIPTPTPKEPEPSAKSGNTPARVALTEREEFSRAQFKMFWAIYPNKIDEDGTFIMWLGLSPIDQSEIVERLPAWVACGQWQEGTRFIPYPKRFLKERMWKSTPPNGGSNGTRQSNKAEQRRERGQQISKNVFGRSSGLVGALTSDLEGRSNGGTGAHLPRDSKGLEAGHTPQSISPSDKDLQVPANPVGSHRGGKH